MDHDPLILSARLSDEAFAYFNALRTAHFPPERLKVGAHLTLFHLLPPSAESEVRRACAAEAAVTPPIAARATGLRFLGRGVAFAVAAPGLEACRAALADRFAGLLSAQDQAPFRPHITIMNKADPKVARAVLDGLQAGFTPFGFELNGLALWRYRGGPWEPAAAWSFRGPQGKGAGPRPGAPPFGKPLA